VKIIQDPSTDFIKEVTTKKYAFIHGTAGGTYVGADTTLEIKDRVNVAYRMDIDGTIYEAFDSKYWAYHTGADGLNKNSVGLEIVNWVYVDFHDGYFWTWTGKKISPEHVVKLNMFRGHNYFHRLTIAQELALPEWMEMVIQKHPTIEEFKTHAEVNTNRSDFPPDYRQVYDYIDKFNGGTLIDKDVIKAGTEPQYTKKEIQARINYLVAIYGYSNAELSRLIKYRNKFLK
jgi:N-acetyl-anhydromuramyl-L-alanine amidase AmpD